MKYKINKSISRNLINIPGWHTMRKIVVIESDDWGSIRMPSKKIYEQFIEKGIRVDKDPYCKFDSLAIPQDLEALFEALTSVKDKNGRHAIITANTIVANPDFKKIRDSGFKQYFYEPFIETLKRSPKHESSFELWKQGMASCIFKPQFHGREHLNINKWMKSLQQGEEITCLAFDLGTFGLTSNVDNRIRNNYMGAFNSGLSNDIFEYNEILKDGLNLFEKIIGFRSLSFIPTTYTWHPDIEHELKKNGIKYLQGMVHQRIPLDNDITFRFKKNNYTGYKSKANLIYISRNAYFEPSQNQQFDWVSDCLKRIEIAFRWKKPAIISIHRLNLIGAIVEENRNENIKLLKIMLKKIVNKWPDVEFMSTDELGNEILIKNEKNINCNSL